MRVIEQGNAVPVELICKCGGCRTKFAIVKSDVKIQDDQRNGLLYSVACPACTKELFFGEDEYRFSFLPETADIPPQAIWERLCNKGSEDFSCDELFTHFEVFAICYLQGQRKAKLEPTIKGFRGWLRSMARAKPVL